MELITHENMEFSVSRHDSTERKRGWTQKGDKKRGRRGGSLGHKAIVCRTRAD